jgi:hypothetical protein
MACEQQAHFPIPRPPQEVFAYLANLPAIAGFSRTGVNLPAFQIFLSNGASLSSWGEDLALSIYDDGQGGTMIVAFSKPKLATTLVDYGKNRKNVETLRRVIRGMYGLPDILG